MERLILDANKYAASIGKASNLSIDSFADIVQAIELVQEKQGIAGTTAKEAATTIQGSLGMTKAAWQNLVTGLSDSEADVGQLVQNLISSAGLVAKNIIPTVKQALSGIGTAIAELAPAIGEGISGLVTDVLPDLVKSAVMLVQSLAQSLIENADSIIKAAFDIIDVFVENLSNPAGLITLIGAAFSIITKLADGLGQALPTLLPEIVGIAIAIAEALTNPESLENVVNGALTLIKGLADGFTKALPVLADAIPGIIQNIVDFLVDAMPEILNVGTQIIEQLINGIIKGIPELMEQIPQIIKDIGKAIADAAPQLWEAGKSLVSGLWKGIKGAFSGKKENIADSVDLGGVETKAKQTATTVSTAFADIGNTTIDLSSATNTATAQMTTLSDSAKDAKDNVVSTFSTMGTEIGNSMAAAAESGTVNWDSLVDGAKNAAKSVKSAFKTLPSELRTIWTKIKNVFNNVPSYFSRIFKIAKENVIASWSSVPVLFSSIWAQIKMAFRVSQAYTWGADMVQNFTNGMKSKLNSLYTILNQISAKFKSILGHSHPTDGPMKDDHKWMPDMMQNFINGIKKYTPELHKTAAEAFDLSNFFNYPMDGYTFTDGETGSFTTETVSIENEKDRKIDKLISLLNIYLPQISKQQIVMDSGVLVGELLPQIDIDLGTNYAYKLRGNA